MGRRRGSEAAIGVDSRRVRIVKRLVVLAFGKELGLFVVVLCL
jgi:hypothetical protein